MNSLLVGVVVVGGGFLLLMLAVGATIRIGSALANMRASDDSDSDWPDLRDGAPEKTIAAIPVMPVIQAKKQPSNGYPSENSGYEASEALLSRAERSFFGVLEQAVGRDHRVFAKVRLADIVLPSRRPSRSGWWTAFNRISCKHVDFVLCDPTDLKVRAVVELDDKSHNTLERGIRDDLVDHALESAGIPVIRIHAKSAYSQIELQKAIGAALVATV